MRSDALPDPLTRKQQRFVEEYLVDLNATQAAIRVGYSEATARSIGCENLTKPNIAKAIAEAQAERSARTSLTQDWVLARLRKNVERAMQTTEIRNADGVTGVFKYDGAVANRALELLGKHLGMFVDKAEIKHTRSHEDWIEILSRREPDDANDGALHA